MWLSNNLKSSFVGGLNAKVSKVMSEQNEIIRLVVYYE